MRVEMEDSVEDIAKSVVYGMIGLVRGLGSETLDIILGKFLVTFKDTSSVIFNKACDIHKVPEETALRIARSKFPEDRHKFEGLELELLQFVAKVNIIAALLRKETRDAETIRLLEEGCGSYLASISILLNIPPEVITKFMEEEGAETEARSEKLHNPRLAYKSIWERLEKLEKLSDKDSISLPSELVYCMVKLCSLTLESAVLEMPEIVLTKKEKQFRGVYAITKDLFNSEVLYRDAEFMSILKRRMDALIQEYAPKE